AAALDPSLCSATATPYISTLSLHDALPIFLPDPVDRHDKHLVLHRPRLVQNSPMPDAGPGPSRRNEQNLHAVQGHGPNQLRKAQVVADDRSRRDIPEPEEAALAPRLQVPLFLQQTEEV